MTTLLSENPKKPWDAPHLLGPSELMLRIIDFDGREQLLNLPPGKSTVGSSSQCQVRIAGPQVRPLHCLIVCEGGKTTVKPWAPGVLLNGGQFTSAEIEPGDQLTIGNLTLEFLAIEQDPFSEPPAARSADESIEDQFEEAAVLVEESFAAAPAIEQPITPDIPDIGSERFLSCYAMPTESDRLVAHLWSANYAARQRCYSLIEKLKETRVAAHSGAEQVQDLKSQLATALRQREELIAEHQQELASERGNQRETADELERLIGELTAAYERSNAAEAQVAELETGIAPLREEIANLQTAKADSEDSLAKVRNEHDQLSHLLQIRDEEIEELRSKLQVVEKTRDDSAIQVEKLAHDLEQVRAELNQANLRCQELVEQANQFQELQESELRSTLESEIADLQGQLEASSELLSQAAEGQAKLEAKVASLEGELLQATEARDQLIAEREHYQQLQQEHELELEKRDQRLEELNQDNIRLGQMLEDSEKSSFDEAEKSKHLEEEIANLRAEQQRLSNPDPAISNRISELEQALGHRDQELAEIREQLATCEAEHQSQVKLLETDVKSSQDELSRLGEAVNEWRDACQAAEAEVAALREAAALRAAEGQSAPELAVALAEEQLVELSRDLVAAQQELADWRKQAAESLAEMQAMHDSLAQSEEERKVLGARVDEEVRRADQLAEELSAAQQELTAQRQQFDELEQQLLELKTATPDTIAPESPAETDREVVHHEEPGDAVVQSETRPRSEIWDAILGDEKPRDRAIRADEFEEFDEHETPEESPRDDTLLTAATLSQESDASEEQTSRSEEPFQHQSFIDQYSHLFDDDVRDADFGKSDLGPQTPAPIPDTPSQGSRSQDQTDDDALEAYMANMMRRVRSIGTADGGLTEQEEEAAGSILAAVRASGTADDDYRNSETPSVAQEKLAEVPLDMETLKNTSRKPPLSANLSEMRQLANSSARQAIASHRKRRVLEGSLLKFVVCGMAVALSAYLLISSGGEMGWLFYGGCLTGAVAVVWGFKVLLVLLGLIREGSWESDLPDSPAELPAAELPASDGG